MFNPTFNNCACMFSVIHKLFSVVTLLFWSISYWHAHCTLQLDFSLHRQRHSMLLQSNIIAQLYMQHMHACTRSGSPHNAMHLSSILQCCNLQSFPANEKNKNGQIRTYSEDTQSCFHLGHSKLIWSYLSFLQAVGRKGRTRLIGSGLNESMIVYLLNKSLFACFFSLSFAGNDCKYKDYRLSLALSDFRLLYTLLCPFYAVKKNFWLGCDIVIVRAERYLGGGYLPWIQNSVSSFQRVHSLLVHSCTFTALLAALTVSVFSTHC